MQSENGKPKRRKRGMIWGICGAAAAAVAIVIAVLAVRANGPKVVGRDVKNADITEFYYTLSGSTNPPVFQRYRFAAKDGKYTFYHETRAGDHWPLTEDDVTVSGETELTPEQWGDFLACIDGGTVRKRQESLETGGDGPWLYLYWKGDRGTVQEFSFSGYGSETVFVRLCEALKAGA